MPHEVSFEVKLAGAVDRIIHPGMGASVALKKTVELDFPVSNVHPVRGLVF